MDTNVSFDDEGRIRVLDADKFEKAFLLQTECTEFATKLQDFNNTVDTLVEVMDGQAMKIERAKLKAIGQRNKLEGDAEERKREQNELRCVIDEKHAELERLRVEHQSLVKVEQEQRAFIEKLSNNEA